MSLVLNNRAQSYYLYTCTVSVTGVVNSIAPVSVISVRHNTAEAKKPEKVRSEDDRAPDRMGF